MTGAITIHIPADAPAAVRRLVLAVAQHGVASGVTAWRQGRGKRGRFTAEPVPQSPAPRVVRWPCGSREVWTVCLVGRDA